MTSYAYDEHLPYVVENRVVDEGNPVARFRDREDAEVMMRDYLDLRIVDTTPAIMDKETKEQFVARYPKPQGNRVLVKCRCDYAACTGWAWSMEPLSPWEEKVDEPDGVISSDGWPYEGDE